MRRDNIGAYLLQEVWLEDDVFDLMSVDTTSLDTTMDELLMVVATYLKE